MHPARVLRSSLARIAALALAISPASGEGAQLIPVDRTFGAAWQNSGYPGEIPSPATIVNVRSFGATGDGAADDRAAIAAAIASLGGAPGVAYFPAGNYLMKSTLALPGGVVLRGERASNTTLTIEHIGDGITISGSQSGVFQPVVSGYAMHSSSIVVTNGAVFAPGDYAEIREDNDAAWGASDWAPKVAGQLLRVTAVTGNTLTLERPLRITLLAAQNPDIRKITPVTEVGIENLRVTRVTTGTATDRDNISTILFNYAARCWVRGVEANNGFGGHITLVYSTKVSVTGCYIHHAADYDGGGSGYGVRLEFKTGECLIENNAFRSLRHSMLLQAGVNGNVFGYNYSREPQRTEFPSEVSGDVVLHGNYPFANLVRGQHLPAHLARCLPRRERAAQHFLPQPLRDLWHQRHGQPDQPAQRGRQRDIHGSVVAHCRRRLRAAGREPLRVRQQHAIRRRAGARHDESHGLFLLSERRSFRPPAAAFVVEHRRRHFRRSGSRSRAPPPRKSRPARAISPARSSPSARRAWRCSPWHNPSRPARTPPSPCKLPARPPRFLRGEKTVFHSPVRTAAR